MNAPAKKASRHSGSRDLGFTLIELMIAITLAIFLAGGLMMIEQSTRRTFATQNLLAQLQDNERLALTFMAEVVQSAGYFPSPQTNLASTVLPAAGAFASMQAVTGTRSATAPGDTVTVRYGAALNDNVFNCRGTTNTLVAPFDTFMNKFWVNNAQPSNPVLTCTFSASTTPAIDVPLVNGVQNLQIVYGVTRSLAVTGSCIDTYLNASQMAAADWSHVCSVKVTMSLTNPLNPAGAPINITRVIAVMNTAGVNS